ncbi:MAG: hypothetical protein AVDCRST_MAG72-649 [uncultured Nocardioidaceae bacterium]|uniref:YtxH domain-containing protein n=1 Tax=uncultured Nocardioidaceae bacterium TaxID=253824 RepID=A0A6J4LQL7_9ACTN|nr:MAG: hypothetical protein AVDCRST_MAG72-649 [uncultured Nocardioidaceae bacterium]
MRKLMLLGAGAIGYVLGAKAGRERYDQISQQAQKIRNNPNVQQKVDEAKHAAKDAAGTASDKVRSHSASSSSTDTGTQTGWPEGGSPVT